MTREDGRDRPARPERRTKPRTPPLIVVPYRTPRSRLGLIPPLLIIAVSVPVLAYRLLSPDWAWNRSAWNHWRRSVSAPPATLAQAPPPRVQPEPVPELPSPAPPAEPPPAIAEPAEPPPAIASTVEPAEPAIEPAPAPANNLARAPEPPAEEKAADSWDDIRREAERKQAEIARLEALKKKEAERLAREPAGRRRSDLAAQQREFERLMDAQIAMHRRMMNELARQMPRGFGRDADDLFEQFAREFRRGGPMPGLVVPPRGRRPQPGRSMRFSRRQGPGGVEIRMKFSDEVFEL